MQLFTHLPILSSTPDLRQQAVLFVHDAQYCLMVLPNLPLKPYSHTPVVISSMWLLLTSLNQGGKILFVGWPVLPFDIRIVATSWYLKKITHDCNGILVSISAYSYVFNLCFHILPAAWRKDRYSSTSLSSSWIRNVIACWSLIGLFLGRPFFLGNVGSVILLRLYRFTQFLICTGSKPKASAISCLVRPSSRICMIICFTDRISVHFRNIQNLLS